MSDTICERCHRPLSDYAQWADAVRATGDSPVCCDVFAAPLRVRRVVADNCAVARDRLLELTDASRLLHEEHAPILLGAGRYRVRIQSQWVGEEVRNVAD